jgi:hypothetical protein
MNRMTNDECGMTNGEPLMKSTVLQPAKHGFVVDVEQGTRRTQVRVFEFEEQPFQTGVCEMPVPLSVPVAIQRLREVMEALRESIYPQIGGMIQGMISESESVQSAKSADEGRDVR